MPGRPWGDEEQWQERNFNKLPPDMCQRIRDYLWRVVSHDQLAAWRAQDAQGIAIGSESPMFDDGEGMCNQLRELMADEYLNAVNSGPQGEPIDPPRRRWEDYWRGALADACTCEEFLTKPP